MGIENEIKELREEMAALRGVLEAVQRDAEFYRDGGSCPDEEGSTQSAPEPAEPAEPAEPDQAGQPNESDESDESDEPDAPTREDVSSLCLSMIRDGAVSKKELLGIIGEFDGARSVKEVPEASIPDLYARMKGVV